MKFEPSHEAREELLEAIADLREETDSALAMQSGGWSSPKVLQDRAPLFVQELTAMVGGTWSRVECWAIALGEGDSIDWHRHWQADRCCVWYLDECEGGHLDIKGVGLEPRRDRLVVFGPQDDHRVLPVTSGERVSVSANFHA